MVARGLGPKFSLLWSASWVSSLGDGVRFTALPLLAAQASSTAGVAFVAAAGLAPWLVFSLHIGVLVDRLNPVRLMFWAHSARSGVMLGLAIWTTLGRPSTLALIMVAFVLGSGEVVFQNSATKTLTGLVESRQLELANGRLQASVIVGSSIVGPMLGALLFAVNPGLPFAVDAASFAVGAALIAAIGPGDVTPAATARRPMLSEIGAGFRWLWAHRGMRLLTAMTAASAAAFTLSIVTLVVLITEDLRASPMAYGVVEAIGASSGFLGALGSSRISRRIGLRSGIFVSLAAMGVAAVVMGVSPSVWLVAAAYAAFLFGVALWNVYVVSVRQRVIPRELFGRVNSVYLLVARGGMLAGALVSGAVSAVLNVRGPIVLGGVLMLLTLVAVPRLVRLEAPAVTPPASDAEPPSRARLVHDGQ